MRYKASTLRIIEKLKELYPEGLCSLQYREGLRAACSLCGCPPSAPTPG